MAGIAMPLLNMRDTALPMPLMHYKNTGVAMPDTLNAPLEHPVPKENQRLQVYDDNTLLEYLLGLRNSDAYRNDKSYAMMIEQQIATLLAKRKQQGQ